MDTTSNFFEALKLVNPPEKQEIFFRLYYDKKSGEVICYSMEDLEGDYIEITKEEFALSRQNVIVKDGKIKVKNRIPIWKLVPSPEGYAVHPLDISIIAPDSGVYWDTKNYDNEIS